MGTAKRDCPAENQTIAAEFSFVWRLLRRFVHTVAMTMRYVIHGKQSRTNVDCFSAEVSFIYLRN